MNGDYIRALEAASIMEFLSEVRFVFNGNRVLDYGCGRQPYRDIVVGAGGEYFPYDRAELPGNVSSVDVGELVDCDVVLMTQVIQYIHDPAMWLGLLAESKRAPELTLVMTYPTTWPEVEDEDLFRFTKKGMESMLHAAGFSVMSHRVRRTVGWPGFDLAIGYGVVAWAG